MGKKRSAQRGGFRGYDPKKDPWRQAEERERVENDPATTLRRHELQAMHQRIMDKRTPHERSMDRILGVKNDRYHFEGGMRGLLKREVRGFVGMVKKPRKRTGTKPKTKGGFRLGDAGSSHQLVWGLIGAVLGSCLIGPFLMGLATAANSSSGSLPISIMWSYYFGTFWFLHPVSLSLLAWTTIVLGAIIGAILPTVITSAFGAGTTTEIPVYTGTMRQQGSVTMRCTDCGATFTRRMRLPNVTVCPHCGAVGSAG